MYQTNIKYTLCDGVYRTTVAAAVAANNNDDDNDEYDKSGIYHAYAYICSLTSLLARLLRCFNICEWAIPNIYHCAVQVVMYDVRFYSIIIVVKI